MNRDGFENSSFNLKSKYQFQEFVLPHKVAILVLIKAFCEVKGKSRNADEIIDESWVQTSQQLRNFSITLLKLIQGPAIDLKDLDSLIKPILLPKTYELFINRLNELKEGGIAILMDFIQSLEILMIDPQFPIPLVHKSSITGLYLRKIMLAFDKLTFSQVTQLFKQYLQYFDKSGINADDNVEEDSIMELMSRKSEHVDHYWELSKTQVTSKKQVELFIGQQAALLQTNEAEAIPPKKLQEKLVHLLQSTPDLAEAQYLSFLNCMRVQEMVGATHSLYHCFDCSMLYSPSENKSGSPVNMFGEANSRSARYAALNLAALQAHFGHKEEAMSALKEAITVAHEANDNACLQHILMRLIRLESDNKEALLERFILRTGEIGIPFLGSLGMLTFAQCKALNGSQPSKVFDSMIKSDIVICQHSMLDLMTNSYGQKAALWDMYGKTSQKRKVPENGDVSRKTARCSAQQVAAILESDDEETLGFDEDYPSDELKTDSDDNVENDNDSESDSDNENPVDRLPVRPFIGHNLDSGWNKKYVGVNPRVNKHLGTITDHVVYRFIANFMEKSNLKVNFSHKYSRIIFCFINNIVRYKAASSVLQAKDIIQMVIDEVEGTNQLVESCRIYLSSELFITELECLAYFNHFVTFPFLNRVQISSQGQLLELLPKLHNDLIKGKIDTLQEYIVSIHGMPTPTLSNNLSIKIIEMMCVTAASAVKLQCGREYGFSEVKLRATDLSLLSEKDLEGLPTNNLVAERDFSRFAREARVAKSRNRRFKAKNIQNNMVLYKCSKEIKIDKLSRTLAAILSCREAQWDVLQHEKLKTRLEAKLNKSKKSEDYTKKLLQNCKSWGSPCTSLEELQQILKEKSDQNIQIGYPELSNDLILYAESLFPLHSIYSKEWMTCKQLIIYIRATWNGRLDDANEALKSMIVVDKCESAYREAELLFLKGEILKSSTEVDKLISNRGQYTDHFHTRTLLLKVELLCHCGNFSQAISIITECLTLCQKKFLTYLEAISKLYIANIQIHRKIHGQTTYVLNQAVLYILSCGSCYDQGIVYYLMAKCIFMNNSKIEDEVNGKKEILKAIEHMEKSAKIFKNIEAMQRFKNCMYWLSFLYHKVGDKIERNRCAKEFRELDSKQDIRLGIFTGLL
ncbi:Anaphase-promoting complex subunit 5 [Nymphon striatum]|nr:Anaphase-promoting complex subunit 5 [Nymphon striatum]